MKNINALKIMILVLVTVSLNVSSKASADEIVIMVASNQSQQKHRMPEYNDFSDEEQELIAAEIEDDLTVKLQKNTK